MAAERVDHLVADLLGGGAAGLGELSGDAAQLDHRHPGAVGEDHGHLQDDLELVADGVGAELGERLGAVAGLQDEGPTLGRLAEGPGQVPGLAGEDQGREAAELGVDPLQLAPRRATPAAARPAAIRHESGAHGVGSGLVGATPPA